MKVDIGINKTLIRTVIWIVVIVVVILVIRKAVKYFKEKADHDKLVKLLGQEIILNDLTYTDAQFVTFANIIKAALNDTSSGWSGVNQNQIYEVYRNMKTKSDVLKLHDAFGTQYLDKAWSSQKDGNYTLLEAIPVFLSNSEIKKIDQILTDNNIDFRYQTLIKN